MARKLWMTYQPLPVPDQGWSYTDREHGRTAPPYRRKHCQGCGRTLPNRSRSWVCPDCYPEYRAYVRAIRTRDVRARQAIFDAIRGRG